MIYFKPDEQRQHQQLSSWSSPSSLSPTDLQSGSPSLVDMPSLIKDYYRTAFNVFLSVPLSLHSDHSDAPSDDDNGDDHEQPQSSSVCSSFSEDEEVEENVTIQLPLQFSSGDLVVNSTNSKTDNSGQTPRALPGMAARLSSSVI